MSKQQTVKGKNSQQCLMIQGMFGLLPTVNPIKIHVEEKHENIPADLLVLPSGEFVCYKVINSAGESLWSSWDSPQEVETWFKVCSLL